MITKKFILENKDKWEEYKEEINKLDSATLAYIIKKEPDVIDFINLDKLNGWDIYTVLLYCPGLVKDLKPYLHKLEGWNIAHTLRFQPGLIKDLKPYLHKLGGADIFYILIDQPKLIKDLKPYLDKLIGENIYRILRIQPKLIKDLKPYLDKLSGGNISDLLEERPELSLLFKYVGTEYQDAAYYYTYPSEISKLDEEEKQELSKKMVELIRKEKR